MKVNTNKSGPVTPHALICAGQGEHARLLVGVRDKCAYIVYDYHSGLEVVVGKFIYRTIQAASEIMEPYTNGAVAFPCDKIAQDDVTEAYCRAWFERARAGRRTSVYIVKLKNAQP